MQNIDLTKRLVRGNNVFNLAVIDNIDFKEASFRFGNIYNVTLESSHATLKMVFQSILPIFTNEILHETRELNVNTYLFEMIPEMDSMQNKIDQSFEKLLNYQINANGNISYNKNLDVEMVENEILTQCKYGYLISPLNIIILTPTDQQEGHLIGICIGNYELQHDSFITFALLFPTASKNNYIISVAHFLSILKKHPDLEQKLQHCASINLARKGHYPALKMHEVEYIKQNIIDNFINQENLQLQIKSAQEEKEELLSQDKAYDEGLKRIKEVYHQKVIKIEKVNTKGRRHIEVIKINISSKKKLLQKRKELEKNNENKAYDEGLKRIKEVYHQKVIKIEKVNTKGRRHIEVIKINISSKKKLLQKRKELEKNNESTIYPISHQLMESSNTENINKQSNISNNKNCTSKRQKIITIEEEKNKLKHLLIKDTLSTEEEIKEVLKELPPA
ncbi:hypothetical protein Glove_46g6 [Diversispora epigaea]|uniref:Uncharacterized protein n=1 Tax=Diversispora epigaea TaxID=1348612 RepID=A0A397JEI9_9GLOM|nr:hypothetical protein Glove_46g6 [Diversispora epigaea]